ncbi:hypothetical protein INT45_006930 [Circinella minor]|uniref:Uncharacterized protein n=1 Tax=Circinella minor TaxID=1195481 RepID=A0A8H7RR18_9FUNG|nr:hypothetical protein INT45_006930 [Circinella minor]
MTYSGVLEDDDSSNKNANETEESTIADDFNDDGWVSDEVSNDDDDDDHSDIEDEDGAKNSQHSNIKNITPRTPPDPYFALHNPAPEILKLREDESYDYKPIMLYLPKVFLWLPHLLIEKKLKCPESNCNSNLKVKGYSKNPPTRRVVDLQSLSAYNNQILMQLPLHLQEEFPAYLTQRTGIFKDLGDVFRSCIQNAIGPKCFQKVLQEIQKLTHAQLEFQYYNYLKTRCANHTIDKISNPPKLKESFSFNDKSGYTGYIPSAQYLRTIYMAMINEIHHLIDKQIMVLDGRVLKGNHTFKIIKHLGRIDGSPTFLTVYTVCNEFEEIRMQLPIPTKLLKHLQFAFEAMNEAYTMYGHKHPEIFFTDNVVSDQSFLMDVLPSLAQDVVPLKANISNSNNQYPVLSIPQDVDITILSTYVEIQQEFEKVLENKCFDCEWPYNNHTYSQGRLALIQIAMSTNIFLLQLYSLGAISDARTGLATICETVLGNSLPKDEMIRLSNWDSAHLTQDQITYAALDAWAGLSIFNVVSTQYFPIGKLVLKAIQGIYVELYPQKLYEPVAYRILAKQHHKPDNITIGKGQAIVTIKQIFKSAATLKIHKKALREFGDVSFDVVVSLKELCTYKPIVVSNIQWLHNNGHLIIYI